jgi:hypothetical protein
MRYLKKYELFREPVNEEFLGALYNAAKGALKAFLGKISEPFKTAKDEFKKGMAREEVKKSMITKMDALLKGATDGINKAEDETALNAMREDFRKEIDNQIAEFDKEIKTVKESVNTINEGKVQDALIGARVAFGMIKKKSAELKLEFDKKYAAAVDLAGKKKTAIEEITTVVNDFKKTVMNDEIFKKEEAEYKTVNKIVTTPEYKVGDELIYLRKGQQKTAWDALTDEQKKAPTTDPAAKLIVNVKKVDKIEGDNYTFTGKDGKTIVKTSVDIIGKSGAETGVDVTADLTKKLGELKTKSPDELKKVASFVDFINKPENADKYTEIEKIISPEATGAQE